MLPYFEDVVFTRTSKKYVTPDTGYDGVIGLRPKGWKPANPKQKRITKQTADVEEWTPELSPKEACQEDWTPERAEAAMARSEELDEQGDQYEDEHEAMDTVTLARSAEDQQDSSVNITLQDELNALGTMVEEDETGMDLDSEELEFGHKAPAVEQHHSPEPYIIETEADKQRGMLMYSF